MSKYIVKNCPAYVLMRNAASGTYLNICGNAKGHIKCCDIDDCVIKQIVKVCEEFKNNYCINNGVHLLIGEILNLLEIEEVE